MQFKKPVGYIFSDTPLKALQKMGFHTVLEKHPEQGYSHALFPLANAAFEIRTILDEDKFFQDRPNQSLQAHIESADIQLPAVDNSNGIFELKAILTRDDLKDDVDLWRYLRIRKESQVLAIHLECKDLAKAKEMCKWSKEFTHDDKTVGLIHLNPTCFDLMISQKGL